MSTEAPMGSVPVQTLWVGGEVPLLVRLCLRSFQEQGHPVHLYVYDEPAGLPPAVVLKDASEILPPDRVFRLGPHAGSGQGSFAGFSELFRVRLLLEKGGFWVDSDVFCLRELDFTAPYVIASERIPEVDPRWARVHVGVIKAPAGSPLLELWYREGASRKPEEIGWNEIGELCANAVRILHLEDFVVPPWVFCPVDWWEAPSYAVGEKIFQPDPASSGVHLFHEMWRRRGLSHLDSYPPASIYTILKNSLADVP